MKKNILKLLVLAAAIASVMLAFASCGCSHEAEEIPAKEATCTAPGNTAGSKCRLCGEFIVEPTEIEQLEHSPKNSAKLDPTCTTDGHEAGVECSVCGIAITGMKVITAAHKPVDIDEVPATCEKDGTTAGQRCSACNEDLSGFEVIKMLPHDLEDKERIEPTCTEAGSEAGKQCKNCDYSEGLATIDPLGHTEKKVDRVEPTCTTDGHEAGTVCEVCGAVVDGHATLAMLGHKPGEITTVTEPSLGVAGKGTSTCTVCKEPVEVSIPAIPGRVWNYDGTESGIVVKGSAATETLNNEDGRTYVTYSYTTGSSGEWYLFFTPEMKLGDLDADTKFIFKTDIKFNSIQPTASYAAHGNPWFMYTGIDDTDTSGDNDHLITFWRYWNEGGNITINPTKKEDGNKAPYNEWFTLTVVTYLSGEKKEGTDIDIVNVDYYVGEEYIGTVKIENANGDGLVKINDPVSSFQLKFKNKTNYESFSISLDNTSFYTEDFTPAPPAEEPAPAA